MAELLERRSSKAMKAFPKLVSQADYEGHWPRARLHNFVKHWPGRVARRSEPEAIRGVALSVQNMFRHGELFADYLKARREVFIVHKGWKLPEVDGMEFDQYDTPRARWIAVHESGNILAGIRLAPTESRCGVYSYMLRDAQLGLLKDIPTDVLYDTAPVSKLVWEATRLFVMPHVHARDRTEVQKTLMTTMASVAVEVGASHVIGIVPAVFKRWMNRIGMDAKSMGPILNFDGERSQSALMNVRKYGLRNIYSTLLH